MQRFNFFLAMTSNASTFFKSSKKMAVFMSPTVFVCRDGPTLKILKRIGNGNPTAVRLQYGRMGHGVPSS